MSSTASPTAGSRSSPERCSTRRSPAGRWPGSRRTPDEGRLGWRWSGPRTSTPGGHRRARTDVLRPGGPLQPRRGIAQRGRPRHRPLCHRVPAARVELRSPHRRPAVTARRRAGARASHRDHRRRHASNRARRRGCRAVSAPVAADLGLDVARIRADFPILAREIGTHPLVYLDSAATSQKPRVVVDAIDAYYATSNANVHRGVHTLGNEATDAFERARARVAVFLDAPAEGLVFVRNTTEAINLVASSYATQLLEPGDRIVVTVMEHHSNIVPWQRAAARRGLQLAAIDVDEDGRLDLTTLDELLAAPTRLVAIGHQSNVLGTVNDIRMINERAHAAR